MKKKKKYVAPTTEEIETETQGRLMDWSAPKGTGGGNVPEANTGIFDTDSIPNGNYDLWN